jgi:trigger factor
MKSKIEKLPNARVKIQITADSADLAHETEHTLAHTTAHAVVKGFRPGKAPKPLLVQTVGKGRILSELVDHSLPELLQQVVEKENIIVIEAPKYSLDKLPELNGDGSLKEDSVLEFTAEADYAPDVQVGDYNKIKIKPPKQEDVTDKMIGDILHDLAERRATFAKVDRAAKEGDRVEISFTGKRNGIPEERLGSTNHPIILGSNTMIPGFEDELVGEKAGQTHNFEIAFPKDYHAKDLADEKVVFEVTIHNVDEKKLPEINDALAVEFGHKKLDELKEAIKQEREFAAAQKVKEETESATLEAFQKLVKLEVPNSLVEREIDRQVDTLREQTQAYGLTFDNYLKHIKKTEEELHTDMRPNSEKAVIIGLGLGEVVKREKIEDENPGVAAIAKLVEIATGESTKK